MDKISSERRKRQFQEKRLTAVFLLVSFSALFYWLSFRVFTSTDCEFFGSKLALVIVPVCVAFGNQGAAAFPFIFATVSLIMALLSLRQHRKPTRRSDGPFKVRP
jgi:hypothetical protein